MVPRAATIRDTLVFATALASLGALCLAWTLVAVPLRLLLPAGSARRCGRHGALVGFRSYLWLLRRLGAYRLDVDCLRELRGGPPLVLAPNHPSLIDALIIIAHEPDVACVMRSELMHSVFLGAGARLAHYIPNEPARRMIAHALAELRRGGKVLLFPEGTRTVRPPLDALTASVGIIAKHAGVPVQTLLIDQDSPYLGKAWPLRRRPRLPIRYRVRLGRRFDPPQDVRAFTLELERYFRAELGRDEAAAASRAACRLDERGSLRSAG